MALTDNLVAWWQLDEASGNRADSSGNGYTLTDMNTVGSAAGLIGTASDHVAANSEDLRSTDATLLSYLVGGAAAWTVCGWINPDDDTARSFGAFGLAGARGLDMRRRAYAVSNDFVITWYDDSSTARCQHSTGVTMSSGVWSFVAAWYDGSKLYARTNATATAGVTASSYTFGARTTFAIGSGLTIGSYFDGKMDMWGVWSRALSSAEMNALYNGGAGLAYPFSTAAGLPVIAWEHARIFGA